MTAVDPEGRIRHQLDVFHSTLNPDGSFIDAGLIPSADGLGQVEYIDAATLTAELVAAVFGYQAHGTTGSTETFDASLAGWHSATLNANCTFTFSGATAGSVASLVLELTQDGTGGRTITLPGSVVGDFSGYDTTAGSTSLLMFFSRDGGTTWFGFIAGGGSGSALEIKDEGSSLDTAVTSIDVTGAWATATNVGHAVTLAVPARALDDLTDVTITSAANADRVRYDSAAALWKNSNLVWEPMIASDGTVMTDGLLNPMMSEVPY